MKCVAASFIALASLVAAISPALSDTNPSGVWLTQAGDARVYVSLCGEGICGRVVWLKEPIDRNTGQPQRDDKNPNPSLAQRPMIGLSIFSGMRTVASNKWSGRIYNADDGQSYTANVTYPGGSTLEVQGCMGAMCGGETWSRISGEPTASRKSR